MATSSGEAIEDFDSFDDLVSVVSADFPQARVDQLERLCELVRAALPQLGEPGCPLVLTRLLVEGAHTLATRPASIQPAFLTREVGDGDGSADAGVHAAAPTSGVAVAAELAALLHVETIMRLSEMSRTQLAAALCAYHLPPTASASGVAEVEAGVREVVVSDEPFDTVERMAAVLDDDDDNGALSEPFDSPSRASEATPRLVGGATVEPRAEGANGVARAAALGAEPACPLEEAPWAELHAKLGSLAGCVSYAALSALPATRWAGPAGLGARVCTLAASVAARTTLRLRGAGSAAVEPCALDGLGAQVWAELLVQRMLALPPSSADLLPPLLAALAALPAEPAGSAGPSAGGRSERLSVCAALQDDARWAAGLGAARPAVHGVLALQQAELAALLQQLGSAADLPADGARAGLVAHACAEVRLMPLQQQLLHVAAAVSALRYWSTYTPQPTAAEQRACAGVLLDCGLWAAAIRLLAPAPRALASIAPEPTISGEAAGLSAGLAGLWRAVLEGACRHRALAAFCAAAPHFRKRADALEPAAGGVSWAWVFAAVAHELEGAGGPTERDAARRLEELVAASLALLSRAATATTVAHRHSADGEGAKGVAADGTATNIPAGDEAVVNGRERQQRAPAALVQTLEALELLCATPHGARLDPTGGGALGGALARAFTGVQAALTTLRVSTPTTESHAPVEAEGGMPPPSPPGGDAEGREKAERTLGQIQLRIKAIRCAAAGGKRD